MTPMLLSAEEKTRFVSYLMREIESGKGIIIQMEKLKVPEPVLEKLKTEVLACTVVVRMLTQANGESVGPSETLG